MKVYEYLQMHIAGDKFYFEARNPDGTSLEHEPNSCLVIDRANGEISLQPQTNIPNHVEVKTIVGIFGIIELVTGPHVIVITHRQFVGLINGEKIFRITATEIIPYAMSVQPVSEVNAKENLVYLSMVQTVLNFESYYISYVYDLTHTLQRLQNANEQFLATPLFKRADQRFVWNGYMLQPLAAVEEAHQFVLPVMLGFVGICTCKVAGSKFNLAVISRRSCQRAGVRLQTRGVDLDGNVANFVETEQVIEFGDAMTSFVQTRGSIPAFWTQYANFRWLPKPKIRKNLRSEIGFRKHVENQLSLYSRMYCINLVNHTGLEKVMRDIMEQLCSSQIQANEDVNLLSFDFHHECRNMNWTRLHQLINALDEQLVQFGYFVARRLDNEIRQIKKQNGVFRTNCMDCLDRTNVVQSLFAKRSLEYQLKFLQIMADIDSIQNYREFDTIYKNLWADNGDAISMQYAGTGALKTDFTRTGRRTYFGALSDAKNACTRWILNNFQDGFRQDAIDLCLGKCAVDKDNPTKYSLTNWQLRHYVYAGVLASLFGFVCCVANEGEVGTQFGMVWLTTCIGLIGYLYVNAEQMVDTPRLTGSS